MKRLVVGVVLASILLSLAGCIIVDRDGRGWDHHGGGERHGEYHEEHEGRR